MPAAKNKSSVYPYVLCALMTALLCILAPLSIPIGPVPVSLQTLILFFTVFLLGTKGALLSYLVYLLLGCAGLPVFAGYAAGFGRLAGPTGGYLVGFFPMILIAGLFYEKSKKLSGLRGPVLTMIGMILGTAVAYAFGTLWFVLQMQCTWQYAFGICVLPFIPFDLIKMVLAIVLGKAIRRPLLKMGMIH